MLSPDRRLLQQMARTTWPSAFSEEALFFRSSTAISALLPPPTSFLAKLVLFLSLSSFNLLSGVLFLGNFFFCAYAAIRR